MNKNFSENSQSIRGREGFTGESRRPALWTSLSFCLFHLLSGLALMRFSGGPGRNSVIALAFFLSYLLVFFLNRKKLFPSMTKIMLMLLMFLDLFILFFRHGGVTGGVMVLAVPMVLASMIISDRRAGLPLLGIWIGVVTALAALSYYFPERVMTGALFVDGYFDQAIIPLFSMGLSGLLLLAHFRSGRELRARRLRENERNEERHLDLERLSLDYPLMVGDEISGIIGRALKPFETALKEKSAGRITRGKLSSARSGMERARQYATNMKYQALMDHRLDLAPTLPVNLLSAISGAAREFHRRFGVPLPVITSDCPQETAVSVYDPVLPALLFGNIMLILSPEEERRGPISVKISLSENRAEVIFSEGGGSGGRFSGRLLELSFPEERDGARIYRENNLSLAVARKIAESLNGSVTLDLLGESTGQEDAPVRVILHLPAL